MADPSFQNTLVFGGTGMLADATRYLAHVSNNLTIAARHPGAIASELGATPVVLDWGNAARAMAAIQPMPRQDLIVSWLHNDGIWLAENFGNLLKPDGRSLRIQGSASLDPKERQRRNPDPGQGINQQTVVLGRMGQATGPRWLTHNEICSAVIKAVNTPSKSVIIAGTPDD